MIRTDHKQAWGDFWARQPKGGGDGGSGCLPTAWDGIEKVQKAAWRDFAKNLPKGAKVLDLATGDGRVMGWLKAARADLKLFGCDFAEHLPSPPNGTKVRGNVRMEELPFGDAQFDVVVSQFGFEYADTALAAAELVRVLRPGGMVALLTHREDGPILAHNRNREAAIRWAIEERDLIAVAKRSLQMRAATGLAVPPALQVAPQEGAAQFGAQSAAWEIAEAIKRSLAMGARDHPANVAALLEQIAGQARNEMGRIASLGEACATASSEAFQACLLEAGLEEVANEPLSDARADTPFADFRRYSKS